MGECQFALTKKNLSVERFVQGWEDLQWSGSQTVTEEHSSFNYHIGIWAESFLQITNPVFIGC